ncbi:hypothetical protein [Nostoc sp.]|uniref:hypothetical protein n=1 Tax=Nostoc sp. TaxID=1180 RepID=UPI002FFB1F2D
MPLRLWKSLVCGIQKSVHAAYKARAANLIVSTTALYKKLSGVELDVSQALVRETVSELQLLIHQMGGEQPNLLPGLSKSPTSTFVRIKRSG